jgi:hypothetical protein
MGHTTKHNQTVTGACVQTLHTTVLLLLHFRSCDGATVEPHRPPFFATTSQFHTEGRRRIREWLSVLTATHNSGCGCARRVATAPLLIQGRQLVLSPVGPLRAKAGVSFAGS